MTETTRPAFDQARYDELCDTLAHKLDLPGFPRWGSREHGALCDEQDGLAQKLVSRRNRLERAQVRVPVVRGVSR